MRRRSQRLCDPRAPPTLRLRKALAVQSANKLVSDVILLAEDDEDHAFLAQRAFKHAGLLNPIFVVEDGEQVISYLRGEGKYANRDEFPLPSLLLLDLKMPNKNGFEVLEWLRTQPSLSALRVIVLTSSGATLDINRAYQLGANSFLTKPLDFRDFVQLSASVKGYWIFLSATPEIERPPKGDVAPKQQP
jgi:CheY-like chemotaxis protein